jgi:hypothetical protein
MLEIGAKCGRPRYRTSSTLLDYGNQSQVWRVLAATSADRDDAIWHRSRRRSRDFTDALRFRWLVTTRARDFTDGNRSPRDRRLGRVKINTPLRDLNACMAVDGQRKLQIIEKGRPEMVEGVEAGAKLAFERCPADGCDTS